MGHHKKILGISFADECGTAITQSNRPFSGDLSKLRDNELQQLVFLFSKSDALHANKHVRRKQKESLNAAQPHIYSQSLLLLFSF